MHWVERYIKKHVVIGTSSLRYSGVVIFTDFAIVQGLNGSFCKVEVSCSCHILAIARQQIPLKISFPLYVEDWPVVPDIQDVYELTESMFHEALNNIQ